MKFQEKRELAKNIADEINDAYLEKYMELRNTVIYAINNMPLAKTETIIEHLKKVIMRLEGLD